MELSPVSRRPALTGGLWLAVAAVILAPLVLLVLIPSVLGLQRFVVSGDALHGSVGRGSLVFAQDVPATSLEVGDVVTFRPQGAKSLVTRKVASVGLDGVRTGDAAGVLDSWVVPLDGDVSVARLHVPWIGYPFLGAVDRTRWLMLAAVPLVAGGLALAADLQRTRSGRRRRADVVVPAPRGGASERPTVAA